MLIYTIGNYREDKVFLHYLYNIYIWCSKLRHKAEGHEWLKVLEGMVSLRLQAESTKLVSELEEPFF